MINHRTLGRTGLRISELSLGGLFVSAIGGEFEQSQAAVQRALALGVNYIDTAPGYYNSEEVLGKILRDVKQPLILSTKLGGRPQPFDPRDISRLRQSVEESLRLLGRDQIDVLMVHEPDRPGQYDWWSDPAKVYGPVVDLLDQLKSEKIIRFTGIGGTTAYELARIARSNRFDVVLTAFNYSLLWREAEIEIFPAAIERNMGIVIGSPLQQGALAVRRDEEVNHGAPWLSLPRRRQYQALYRYLDEINLPLAEAGIRFVLSNPNISCVLMGARSAGEVEQNVAAAQKGPLPRDVLNRLNEIAAMVPFRPYEEPFWMPFSREYWGPGGA
ncbi:MAG TPA: aldo/keto reductase [Tepidisphaeraceae bacterium]|jgi:aryl-alcohol dehydrogenase-like predicted oxidoreductase